VNAVERAIIACGHVPVDMKDFPAADKPPADLCAERVRSCAVYVGLLGMRYGSPVRGKPEVSYTELEFATATEAGLKRLVFLLDDDAEDVGIPPSRLIDHDYGARQEDFRHRVWDSGLVTQAFTDPATLGQLVERSLRELADTRRLDDDGGRGTSVPAVVITGEIPQEPLGFQPRVDLLAALDAPGPATRVVHALTGMRGVGKTHLAAAYARAKVAERWRLVAWINAEEQGGLLAGLAEAAAGLGLDAEDAQAAGRALRHRLEADGERCLLVFDNATDPAALRPWLPAAGSARVIITSNYQAVASLGASVPVDVFSEVEALTFLAARTGQADAAGAQALAVELGFLPLALAQAAAVIAGQHVSYGTYLDRLRRLPIYDLLMAEDAGQYPRGVAAAVLVSLENVRRVEGCEAVMNLLAVLSPSGIRRSLVHTAGDSGLPAPEGPLSAMTPEATDRVLARLAGVSLLTFSIDGSAVTAHRLVMRVIRENLAATGSLAAACRVAEQLLSRQVVSLEPRWHQDRAAVRDLVEQVMALNESVAGVPSDEDLNRRLIWLRGWALWFLNHLGDSLARNIEIGERLLPDCQRTLGPDHHDTLTSQHNLANAYYRAGRISEAITLDEQTLASIERTLGPDHPDTLQSRHSIAESYRGAGRFDEAIALHEQILAARERILGPDHLDTLISRGNLASAYHDAGRISEAITLDEQTLAVGERTLGPDHPDTLQSRNNLAVIYRTAGRLDEAITLHEQTLTARERTLGPDHPDTRQSRDNLADAYQAAGRTQETERLGLSDRQAGEEFVGDVGGGYSG
jgi:tetratricopeptide (TPR) repeat protein